MATAEFFKFADILSAALSQHHLSGFEIAQLEFILKEIGPGCSLEGLMLIEAETPILWPPDVNSFEKTLMLRKIEGRRRRG